MLLQSFWLICSCSSVIGPFKIYCSCNTKVTWWKYAGLEPATNYTYWKSKSIPITKLLIPYQESLNHKMGILVEFSGAVNFTNIFLNILAKKMKRTREKLMLGPTFMSLIDKQNIGVQRDSDGALILLYVLCLEIKPSSYSEWSSTKPLVAITIIKQSLCVCLCHKYTFKVDRYLI